MVASTYACPRRLRRAVVPAVAGAALTVVLAGCGGGGTPDDAAGGSPSADTGSSSSASASPSPSASAADPTPEVVDGSIEATDKSFTLTVPSGWTSPDRGVPKPFVMAVQDQGTKTDQLVVSSFSGVQGATETAQQTASGLQGQKVPCDTTSIEGRSLIDCHYAYQGRQVRKMLFPFIHDGNSALLLYQTLADTRAEGYAKLKPILATWRWADGSALGAG